MQQGNHTSIGFSLGLHAVVIAVSVAGLPHLRRPPPSDIPLVVELVSIAPETNVPVARRKPPKKPPPEVKKEEKPEPPKPKKVKNNTAWPSKNVDQGRP